MSLKPSSVKLTATFRSWGSWILDSWFAALSDSSLMFALGASSNSGTKFQGCENSANTKKQRGNAKYNGSTSNLETRARGLKVLWVWVSMIVRCVVSWWDK